jgi:hypothetical protein
MNKVSKAESFLQKLAQRTGMTKQGLEWLKCAIDPFHDGKLTVSGYPDGSQGASVVQVVKQSKQISKPANITTATWDGHVYFSPTTNSRELLQYNLRSDTFTGILSLNRKGIIGGVVVNATGQGGNLTVVDATLPDTFSQPVTQIPVPFNYQKHRWRLIGVGIEIHDTTAALYKQGAITTYQVPQSVETFVGKFTNDVSATTNSPSAVGVQWLTMPPQTQSDAMLLSGSTTWEMKQGAYVVPTFCQNENPPQFNQPRLFCWSENQDASVGVVDMTTYVVKPSIFNGALVTYYCSAPPEHDIPFNTKGIILTGLNPNSTFQVNVNYWIERFPQFEDDDLVVLASPSAEFDSVALEMYNRIMSIMPVGVPVSENGFGDWFFGGISTLIDGFLGKPLTRNLLRSADDAINTGQSNNSPNNIGKPQSTRTYVQVMRPRTQMVKTIPTKPSTTIQKYQSEIKRENLKLSNLEEEKRKLKNKSRNERRKMNRLRQSVTFNI